MFTFIDLFSGVGGFRIPLESIGGKCIGFSEIDKAAIEVYKNNFQTKNEIDFGDIVKLKKLPKSDLYVGGVPCQAWSVAGKKEGFKDPRGKLWKDCIRIVGINKPKAFIFENVKGLYDPRNRSSLELIVNEFKKKGYQVSHKLLNAYDYGLPQNRDRIFIVGIRKDIKSKFSFPFPSGTPKSLYKLFDDIQINKSHVIKKSFLERDLFGERVPASRNRFQKTNELNDFFIFCDTRDGHTTIHSWDIIPTTNKEKKICMTILKNRRRKIFGEWDGNPLPLSVIKDLCPNATKKDLDKLVKKEILKKEDDGRYELAHTKNSAGIFGIYRIFLPQSDIFSTITATENRDYIATRTIKGSDPRQYKNDFIKKIYEKGHYRLLSGRETALLQGFPKKFKIHSKDKIAKRQFGNAVPTNVVKNVAKELIRLIV